MGGKDYAVRWKSQQQNASQQPQRKKKILQPQNKNICLLKKIKESAPRN